MFLATNPLAVCIPTYKRSHLLELLISDLLRQTRCPDHLILVDGDPESGNVKRMLAALDAPVPISYVPSNHGNLAYQRYLGWRVAANSGASILVYFDDDERLMQSNVLELLTLPLGQAAVVGVGCHIRFGENSDGTDAAVARGNRKQSVLVKMLGSGRKELPGRLTPSGHRVSPTDDGSDYIEVDWLRGGVMAYWMAAISQESFSDDLFALDHVRCGLGEDTILSRRIGASGKLLYTFRTVVDHPNADKPKSYPHEGRRYAYSATYSRRFLNDHYRVYAAPTASDRWNLVKSYAGNLLLVWMRVLKEPSKLNFALARGTTLGAIHGVTRPPTAKQLTPDINWWADAESAFNDKEVISRGSD